MSVDVTALKTLAEEKKLPLERLINAIENEVAKAYAELPVAKAHGRAVLNRQTGEILIYVPLLGPDGDRIDTGEDRGLCGQHCGSGDKRRMCWPRDRPPFDTGRSRRPRSRPRSGAGR